MVEEANATGWLAARLAGVPPVVRQRMEFRRDRVGQAELTDVLTDEARKALERALAGDGDHRGAFHLLAADGFATLACQAALEADDADEALARILDRLLA